MAVLQMERIHICAMKRDRKKILELLQRRGSVEVSELEAPDTVFEKTNASVARSLFLKNAETAEKALEILKKYSEDKNSGGLSFLKGRTAIPLTVSDAFYDQKDDVLRTAQRILQLERDVAEAKAEILRSEAQEEALAAWLKLPVPQTFTGTKKTAVFIGSLDGAHSLEDLYTKLAATAPGVESVHIEIVSDTPELTSFLVVVLKKDATIAEEGLRLMGFARPASMSHKMPEEKRKSLQEKRKQAEKIIAEAEKELESYGERREDIKLLQDHMTMRYEKYGMLEKLIQTSHVFILEGYVPQFAAKDLQDELNNKFDCAAEAVALEEGEEAPVLLKNNKFSEPTEAILESYSMPSSEDIDPIGVMSIFYYIMFGLMFSDAGYGLVLAVLCGVALLKFKNMEYNMKKSLRMFFWCGISTIFWGVIFSSYFGDVFDSVATLFFGRDPSLGPVVPPVWFAPLENPMWLLMFCLAIGILHLTTAYILKGVTCAKNKQYIDILYESVFYIALIYPLVIVFMGTAIFEGMVGFKLNLPSIVVNVCLAIAAVCMVGILFTGGRESKNWVKRLLKGLYALYNALAGWLSDILSYSRLLALGLATGVIGSVINQLGGMTGNGFVGLIMFIVVFIFGHTLNFGINILGSYVHSNRLEYVEFFGKFYEGGGRKFEPFGIHTKYYKIEEETQNV